MTHDSFVQLLWDKCLKYNTELDSPLDIQMYGRKQGWLEEQDVLFGDKEIERRHVARIVHQFIRIEKKEPDEIDWKDAMKLQDLFDCRACVNHVAQVYTKGIMTEYSPLVFGMYQSIDEKQAEEIIEKAMNPKLRHKEKVVLQMQASEALKEQLKFQLTYDEAISVMKEQDDYILIDVRNEEEYKEWHLENAINMPAAMITSNPMALEVYKEKNILLYCKKGYNSEIAARSLIDKGYKRVFSFGTEK